MPIVGYIRLRRLQDRKRMAAITTPTVAIKINVFVSMTLFLQ
jgi:hypothetical protein